MNQRLKSIHPLLEEKGLDGILICLSANISYLTESTARDAYLLVSKKKNIYFTDSRYSEEAGAFLKGNTELKISKGSVFKLIAEAAISLGLKQIGFEERCLPYAEFKKIEGYSEKKFKFLPTYGIVETLREIKTEGELLKIRRAAQISALALKHIQGFLIPGIKECEVVAELERFIRYQGARASAFDIIVASGPNSSRPHHLSGSRKLKNNEPVLIDFGADFEGYKSDLTRIFFLGKINVLARKVYNIVLKAQELAIKRVHPGAEIAEIDGVARSYIEKKGYGDKFTHNLGHGFGLEIHEQPCISPNECQALKPGMVFTVEPGIYLPGKFGIRIEDMVLVTRKGCEVLSEPPVKL